MLCRARDLVKQRVYFVSDVLSAASTFSGAKPKRSLKRAFKRDRDRNQKDHDDDPGQPYTTQDPSDDRGASG